jgi:CheY-like chemotaxis protein
MNSILIIDDNLEIRENIAEILELAGYKTITAENGKVGVDLALREKPAVIVCDIMMPALDGYGVIHLLKKNPDTENIPFIFLTAKAERKDLRKGMEAGADDYITKPFEQIELLNAIETRLKKVDILDKKYDASVQGATDFVRDAKNSGFMSMLAEKFDVDSFGKKQTLYHEGKQPRFLYYLVNGKVKGFRGHPDGKEYITDLYSSGDFIGYSALLSDKNYDDSAVILEESEIMRIPKDDFLQMIFSDISITTKFIGIMTQNVKEKEERLMKLAYSSLRMRVASALIDIYQKFGKDKPIEISREDISRFVGTATESLIRTLSDFREEKLINIQDGKIVINDIEKLKNLLY